MQHTARLSLRLALSALAVVLLLLTAGHDAIARGGDDGNGGTGGGGGTGKDALTLRVNPAIAAPGGVFAVVLRTYAPRPIRQGQVLVKVGRKAGTAASAGFWIDPPAGLSSLAAPAPPIATLLSATVYSVQGDSVTQATISSAGPAQTAMIRFRSASAGVNAADGPMIVLRFRLNAAAVPGQQFDLQIDPAVTALVDGQGKTVTLDPRPGVLTVRSPKAPYTVEADASDAAPGTVAELGIQTFEPFPLSGGRLTLRYDPRLAADAPTVRLDPRYGKSTWTADTTQPGRLVIDFKSADRTFNTVPGTVVAVSLPIKATAAIGTTSPVTLDPAQTWLLAPKGGRVPLKLQAGSFTVK